MRPIHDTDPPGHRTAGHSGATVRVSRRHGGPGVIVGVLAAVAVGAGPGLHAYLAAQRVEHGFPGVALAVVDGERIVSATGSGHAGRGRPMTADTPVDIGSVTKTITAVAVLQLVERGAVELDAPVRRYLPWFALADPAASAAVTVRHLLTHTSGVSETDTGGPGGAVALGASPGDAVRALRSVSPSAPPGTEFHYLNVGYTALALVVEATSGRSYPDQVREHVFVPLRMDRSSVDPRAVSRPDLAQGHSRLFGLAMARDTPVAPSSLGHGGATSTARDLARLLLALARGGELDGARVLSPASVAAMRTPPAGVPGTGYGFGWAVGTADGVPVGGHDGAAATFSGAVVLLPDRERGFVVLAASEHLLDHWFGLAELTGGVTALLARRPPPGGVPGRWVGLVLLAVFGAVLVGAVRGLLRLPRWRERSRGATRGRTARDVAPHLVVPALLLTGAYGVVPRLIDRPFTAGWVGAYFLPDVLLILVVAIVADLVQAAYKGVVAVRRAARRSPSGRRGDP